jgi:hypothetical protein
MKRTTIDEDIETMVRHLIEVHLADDVRDAALDWLEKRANAYRDMQELGSVEDK